MDSDSRAYWITTLVLLIFAAVFALTETAVSSVSKQRIRSEAEKGNSSAKRVLFILENFDDAITTLLICTNIVHIAMASVVTIAVTRLWGLGAVSLSTVITTVVVFFAGEMLPKSIAKKKPEYFSCAFSAFLCVLMKVLKPLSGLLSRIGKLVSEKIKGEPELTVTEDELHDMIEDLSEEGSIDEEQADLLNSALDFARTKAGMIMTPSEKILAVDIDSAPEDILDFVQEQNHSRFPVYKGNINNIVGMLHIRKFMKSWLRDKKAPDIRPLLDRVYYTYENADIDELLKRMSEKKVTMAVVRDSSKKTVGIVTVEDILEELVGEIYDEEDSKTPRDGKGGSL